VGNSKANATGGLNWLKRSNSQVQEADNKEQGNIFQVNGRGAISDKENPREFFGIRQIAELPL
jgi:hypothetical protein